MAEAHWALSGWNGKVKGLGKERHSVAGGLRDQDGESKGFDRGSALYRANDPLGMNWSHILSWSKDLRCLSRVMFKLSSHSSVHALFS